MQKNRVSLKRFSHDKDFSVESAWYQTNKGNDEFIKNSYKLREQTMRSYVLQQHQTAQNSRAPSLKLGLPKILTITS